MSMRLHESASSVSPFRTASGPMRALHASGLLEHRTEQADSPRPGLKSRAPLPCFWLLGHMSQLGRCCARVSQIRSTGPLTVRKPYASRPKQSCVLTLQDLAFGSGMCCRTIILSTVSPTATDLLHSTNSLLQVTQMRGTKMYNLFQFEP